MPPPRARAFFHSERLDTPRQIVDPILPHPGCLQGLSVHTYLRLIFAPASTSRGEGRIAGSSSILGPENTNPKPGSSQLRTVDRLSTKRGVPHILLSLDEYHIRRFAAAAHNWEASWNKLSLLRAAHVPTSPQHLPKRIEIQFKHLC